MDEEVFIDPRNRGRHRISLVTRNVKVLNKAADSLALARLSDISRDLENSTRYTNSGT